MSKRDPSFEGDALEVLRFTIPRDEVAYRFISKKVRALIYLKALAPGVRLPTLTKLAQLWGTNYFTVQTALTPLVEEGLLVRKQRTGTFVAEVPRPIKAVAVYFGTVLWTVDHVGFFQALYAALCGYFERFGASVHLFMDERTLDDVGTPWPPLMEALERGEIDAVFGTMLGQQIGWLEDLPVPVSLLASGASSGIGVTVDMSHYLDRSLARLKRRGCQSVALISTELPGMATFCDKAAEYGLKSRPEWIFENRAWPQDFGDFGYESFGEIFSGSEKPDGLIVYPDSIVLGVILAVLKHGIRVPEELNLVLHCNDTLYFPCPIPADWQVTHLAAIVNKIGATLRGLAQGEDDIVSLYPFSAEAPPLIRRSVSPHPARFASFES